MQTNYMLANSLTPWYYDVLPSFTLFAIYIILYFVLPLAFFFYVYWKLKTINKKLDNILDKLDTNG